MRNRFFEIEHDNRRFRHLGRGKQTKQNQITRASSYVSNTFQYLGYAKNKSSRVSPNNLSLSAQGVSFIAGWEGFRATAYDDAEGFCTIGFGHLIARDHCRNITLPSQFAHGITRAVGESLLQTDISRFERAVQRDITVPLFQYEFDALVSLLYNTGANFLNTGGTGGGVTNIKRYINAGRYHDGADEMSDVTNHGLCGLVRRRRSEIDLFKNANYTGNTSRYTCH